MDSNDLPEPVHQGQVQVHFTTTSPDIELPEEKRQLLVPTNVRRYGLSQILNSESMLNTPSPIPFDFLINGTFLRTTITEYLTTHGLSSETTLNLQYVRSLIPPLYEASFEHDDWVSSVDILSNNSPSGIWSSSPVPPNQARILSSSYDGLLRVWNKSGQVVATSPSAQKGGHTTSIKAAKFISSSQIASAGLDRIVRVWKYTENDDHFSAEIKPSLELHAHKASIDALAVHAPTSRILSASGDGTVGLWTTHKSSAPSVRTPPQTTAKRRKLSTSQVSTPQRGPLSLLSAHTAPVTSVIFHPDDPSVAYSTSLDHTLRTHDLTTSATIDIRTTAHSLLSLCALPASLSSSHLLAAGTSARHITILDPRTSATTTSVMTLRGHTNVVTSLASDPASVWGLASGGAEGVVRVWDLRMTREGGREEGGGRVGETVYQIEREGKKGEKRAVGGEGVRVLGVAWDGEVGIVSGGADKRVQINRGEGVTRRQG